MAKQFPDVKSTHGAPMGRASFGIPENCEPRSVSLFRVRFVDGDYDDGGAYWGGGRDAGPLYCARDDSGDYRQFTRAPSRAKAAELLGLSGESAAVLKRGV